ncbi:Hypothetical_protein [Hexamita inflata]|uniref:Hypothetical_protein n=1 Tax=Hexamita inflata TaxID=28002 RepID=A0AA86TDT5_9EUKA|nr:Hypothetical protein HINF_LOCUS2640 [Hexamita inflata]
MKECYQQEYYTAILAWMAPMILISSITDLVLFGGISGLFHILTASACVFMSVIYTIQSIYKCCSIKSVKKVMCPCCCKINLDEEKLTLILNEDTVSTEIIVQKSLHDSEYTQ